MSDSVQPLRQQPARLPHPWDSPGKNTGVGFIIIIIYYICSLVQSKFKSYFSCKSNSTSNQKLLSFYYIDLAPWIIDSILLSLLFSIYLLEVCSSIYLFIFLEETGYSFWFLDCNTSLSLFISLKADEFLWIWSL